MTFTSWLSQGLHAHPLRKPYYLSIYYNKSLLVCFCFYLVPKLCLTLSRLLCPWDFPGKNNGVGCHILLPLLVICVKHRRAYMSIFKLPVYSSLTPFSSSNHKFILEVCESVSDLQINSFVSFFFRFHIEAMWCIYILIQWNISQLLKTMK